jgi:hypothetical protein
MTKPRPPWQGEAKQKKLDQALSDAIDLCDEQADGQDDEYSEMWASVRDTILEAKEEILRLRGPAPETPTPANPVEASLVLIEARHKATNHKVKFSVVAAHAGDQDPTEVALRNYDLSGLSEVMVSAKRLKPGGCFHVTLSGGM